MQKVLLVLSMALISYGSYSQDSWKSYYEDSKVKIEYQLADCNDAANGFNFKYYLLRVANKTQESLVVQYVLEPSKHVSTTAEHSNRFILAPSEVRKGNCTAKNKSLTYFAKDNKDVAKTPKPIIISKIHAYAL
ncbi:hypothetical protein [Marixanthomonas spongiae]|uniref:Uncharacterized protein n=1 Tax=Marixanthomonas spongiae TaxID=2174845 RepID=A0A2U0I5N9_9FLAO|nr:hypothetical protein [Marixanthomonas spongiae]PVW16423.1 hypothetical protein DDV96_03965 [Marixanthomonas spongiae]